MDIKLWNDGIPYFDISSNTGKNVNAPSITPYLIKDGAKRGCVIVFPGGGYTDRADHEGEPVALWLNSLGFNSFVLNYRVAPYKYPAAFADAQRAVRYVRHNCAKFDTDPDKIGILGFSAGGHLACISSALYDSEFYTAGDEADKASARPDAAVLCYPVVSLLSHTHAGSVNSLLGENADDEIKTRFSGEKIAHGNMPPVFLWHTVEDGAVPVENTMALAAALRNNGVPFECHLFNEGWHGLGLGGGTLLATKWAELCGQWLQHLFCR